MRWQRPVSGAAALLAATLACVFGTASAALLPMPFPVFTQAVEDFDRLAAAKRPSDLPRLADPEAASVLRTIWAEATPDPNAGPDVIAAAMLTTTIETYEFHILDTYLAFPVARPASVPSALPGSIPNPAEADRLAALFGPELAGSLAASFVAIVHVSVTAEHYRLAHPPDAGHAAGYASASREPNVRIAALAQRFMGSSAFGPDAVARVAAAFADHAADFAIPLP